MRSRAQRHTWAASARPAADGDEAARAAGEEEARAAAAEAAARARAAARADLGAERVPLAVGAVAGEGAGGESSVARLAK